MKSMNMNKYILLRLLYECALAYRDVQPYCEGEYRRSVSCGQRDVQCFIKSKNGEVVIAFRGTDSVKDIWVNAAFSKRAVPFACADSRVRAHRGFVGAYLCGEVREEVFRAVSRADVRRVLITGHSLGAAMATLAAFEIKHRLPDLELWMVGFGCPRVGNRAFCRAYEKCVYQSIRVENGNDVVCKIPPVLMGYRHAGAKYHLGALRIPLCHSLRQHRYKAYFEQLLPMYFL